MSVDSIALNGAGHILNWIGGDGGNTCINSLLGGLCSIQAGYGTGNVGGKASGAGLHAYMEEEDLYGYDPSWPGIGLTQNDFVTVHYSGITNSAGAGRWDAYIQPAGSSPILVGQAWFPNPVYSNASLEANTESNYSGASDTCAGEAQYEYYGTTGAGTVTVGSQIQAYETGVGWKPMTNYLTYPVSDTPYNEASINSNIAFRAWGSS